LVNDRDSRRPGYSSRHDGDAVTRFLILFALAAIAGCSQVGQFTAADAKNAAAIDPAGASCYMAIGATATAAGAVQSNGVLTLLATKRALSSDLQSPACAPIEAGLLAELLKSTPVAPFVP
jgi:hypothetical protein